MSDDTAAFLQQREDAGPLAGLLEALRASLDRACQAVRRQAQGLGNENAVLQSVMVSLLQDGNVLARLGLHGPDRMLQALGHLTRQFIVRPETCTLQAAASLERASDALLEHLGACVRGRQPPDVALFPQYRELQTLRGEARIHPADLWHAPEPWAWRAAELPDRLPESGLAIVPYYYSASLRLRMDASVLQMIKNGDADAAYALRDMALGLAFGESREAAGVFWQIAAAYFEALALNYLPADLYAKRTASRVLLQYGALSRAAAAADSAVAATEGGEGESGGSADIVSEQLAQDLLFFCAQAVPDEGSAPILAAVRAAYGLTHSHGVNYELPRYGRFDPLALAQTRQRIRAVAETWPKLVAGDASQILQAGEQFGQLGVSLLTLQPEQRELARALLQAMDLTVRKNQPPAEPLATEVAAAILFLEAAYDDLDPTQDIFKLSCCEQLAERIDRAVDIAEGEGDAAAAAELPAAPPWLELLHERVRERRAQMAAMEAEAAAASGAQEEPQPPVEVEAESRTEPEPEHGIEAQFESGSESGSDSEPEPEVEPEPDRAFASSGFHLELTPDDAFDDADQFKVIGPLQIPIPDYNLFLNETDGWSRQLQTELSEWSLELHRPLPVSSIALTHSLTASAAAVGFDELAALARSLALAMLKVRARQQGNPEDARIFSLAADNIRYLLHQFAAGFLKTAEPGLVEELQLISGPEVEAPPAWFEDPQNAAAPGEPQADEPQDERLAQAQAVRNIAVESYDDADLFNAGRTESTPELDFGDSEAGASSGDALDADGFAAFEAQAASVLPQLADTLRQWSEQPEDEGARLQALNLLSDLSEAARQAGAEAWSSDAQQLALDVERIGNDEEDGGEWGYAAVTAAQIEPLLLRLADLQQAFDELKLRSAEGGPSFDMSADADAGPESEFDMTMDEPPPSREGASARSDAISGAMSQTLSQAALEKIGQQAVELLQTRGRIEERLDLVHGGLRELDIRLEHLRNVLRQAGVPPETIKELGLVQAHLQEALGEVEDELAAQIQQTMDLQDGLHDLQSSQSNPSGDFGGFGGSGAFDNPDGRGA